MEQPIVNVVATGTTRDYDAQYKTKVLKANIPFAEQVTDEDTKYVIRWNFDLDEDEVEIPANCILQFDGGSLSNGTLIGNNTNVQSISDNIFNEDIIFAGTFTGKAYADWIKTSTDDAAIQINKLDTVFKTVHFKTKQYHVKTQCYVRYNLVGDSKDSTLIVHTPIAMEYQLFYGKIENITFNGYNNGGTCFLRCNDKNFYNCKFQYFDILFNVNVYIGRTSLNGCRIEDIRALNVNNALVNLLIFNNCFINHCSGWFARNAVYTNLSFNNCNIQETDLIGSNVDGGTLCFNNVTFSNSYIETTTFDFRTLESSGSIYFFGCHFCVPRIINTGQNSGQYASLANLLITFDSCEIQIPNITTDLVQFNINNYIMIKIVGPCTIGAQEGGIIRPVANIESIINNPTKLWYEISSGFSGNWVHSIKYGNKNIDGTFVSKVKIVDQVFHTQDEVNAIFNTENTIYKIVGEGTLYSNVTINMPANCVLDFQGGFIKAFAVGHLVGNNTSIITNGKKRSDLFENVMLTGTFTDRGSTRPTTPFVAQQYFDESLTPKRPIWYNGTNWVYATGLPTSTKCAGTWDEKPDIASVPVGFEYYCKDKKSPEASGGVNSGVLMLASSSGYWVDTLGRVVGSDYPDKYKGAFADKPTLAAYQAGQQYFDTTKNRIIIWNGTRWVDTLGNPVDTVYPKVIGTPTAGNLAKFNSTDSHDIEDAGVAPQV